MPISPSLHQIYINHDKPTKKLFYPDYETYIRKHILLPAGCFDMHLGKNLYKDKLPNEVRYYEVSNAELVAVNEEIRNHPVEIVGKKLRGYMTAMKAIVGK